MPSRIIGEDGIFPGVTRLIRNQYPDAEIGFGYTWSTIGYLYEQEVSDWNYNASKEALLCDSMAWYIATEKPTFAFMAFDQPDGAGHKFGWESDEYLEMCKVIDGYVGKILAAVDQAGIKENTIVIFTSDHGGIEKGHGGKTMQEMEAPFVLWGKNIRKGYQINESVMIYDCASTITHIFALEQPQVWIGRPVLSIFE